MHRVAQAALLGLIDRMHAGFGDDLVDAGEQFLFSAGAKSLLQFVIGPEMIFDRLLSFAGDQKNIVHARAGGLRAADLAGPLGHAGGMGTEPGRRSACADRSGTIAEKRPEIA